MSQKKNDLILTKFKKTKELKAKKGLYKKTLMVESITFSGTPPLKKAIEIFKEIQIIEEEIKEISFELSIFTR